MLTIQQYCKAKSLDEAYELLQKNRMNQIIAGMLWLRMQERTIPVAIDLCDLHLDMIEEDEDSFTIGAMKMCIRDSINDMLMMTRMEQKRDSICMVKLDFSSLCASVCEDLRLIREKNIALSWQLEEHVLVMGNRELLQRLLANLIANAYRYGKEHGHCLLYTSRCV